MKIAIVGSRGIPAKYGGFETFAQEISTTLVRKYKYQVTVIGDAGQKQSMENCNDYKGVELLFSKYSKSENPILFYYDSIKRAINDCDLVFSCGPAGGMFAPLVHHYGKKIITNTDGVHWKRAKWNFIVKQAFKMFEFLATRLSDYVACDAQAIEEHIRKNYKVKNTFVAEYGAYPNPYIDKNGDDEIKILEKYSLKPNAYHLVVCRLEPENHVHLIIEGYCRKKRKYPLAIVGNLIETKYVSLLRQIANKDVLFLQGIYNRDELYVVRANSLSYFHGHSVGGTNPSLLEAMASQNLCVCHNNIFNKEVVGEDGLFFSSSSDIDDIIDMIESDPSRYNQMKNNVYDRVINKYSWDIISEKYSKAFERASQYAS